MMQDVETNVWKIEIKEEIDEIEGNDLRDKMLNERREWILEQKRLNAGALPKDLAKFYERENVE